MAACGYRALRCYIVCAYVRASCIVLCSSSLPLSSGEWRSCTATSTFARLTRVLSLSLSIPLLSSPPAAAAAAAAAIPQPTNETTTSPFARRWFVREPHDRYLSHRIHSTLVMSAFGLVVCLVSRLHSLTRHTSDATPRRASEISPSCALELLDGRAGERRHSHGTSRCLQHLTLPGRNLGIVGLQRLPTPSPPPTHHHRAPCQCRGSSSFVLIVSCTLRNRWKIFLLSSGSSAGSSPTI